MAFKSLVAVVLVLATVGIAQAASCTAIQVTSLKKNLIGGATSVNNFMGDAIVQGAFNGFCYVNEGSGYGRTNALGGGLLVGVSDVPIPTADAAKWVAAFGGQLTGPSTRTGVLQMPTLLIYFGVATSFAVPVKSYLGATVTTATAYKTGTPIKASSLGAIWSGAIDNWSDVQVSKGCLDTGCGVPSVKANPCGKPYPSKPLMVAYRSDSSGSTQVFITFFSVSSYYAIPVAIGSTWPSTLRAKSNWIGQDGTSNMYNYLKSTDDWAVGYMQAGYIKGDVDIGNGPGVGTPKLLSMNILNQAGKAGNVWTTVASQTLPQSIPLYNESGMAANWNIVNRPGAATAPMAATPFFLARENYNLAPAVTTSGAGSAPAADRNQIKSILNAINKFSPVTARSYAVALPPNSYRNKNILATKAIIGA